MKYKVIENHRTEYPNSILLSKGEKVFMGEELYQDCLIGFFVQNWINHIVVGFRNRLLKMIMILGL